MLSRLWLLLSFAPVPFLCSAQDHKCSFALAAPSSAKVNTDFGAKIKSSPFGVYGFGVALKADGMGEQSIAFLQTLGLCYELQSFRVAPGERINVERLLLDINPSILIPSKWGAVKYNVGIGAIVNVDEFVGYSLSAQGNSVFYMNVDSSTDHLMRNSRKLVPYISLGMLCDVRAHIKTQLVLQQALLNYYEPGTSLNYGYYFNRGDFPVSYRPLYFGLRFFYFF